MTPEKHFERYATAIAHDMEASQTPFLLAIRPNVTERPEFFICAGLGNDIDHANNTKRKSYFHYHGIPA